jgi:hypothetical protein
MGKKIVPLRRLVEQVEDRHADGTRDQRRAINPTE